MKTTTDTKTRTKGNRNNNQNKNHDKINIISNKYNKKKAGTEITKTIINVFSIKEQEGPKQKEECKK